MLTFVKLLRGGSWFDRTMDCRSAYRRSAPPVGRLDNLGFRVCCLPKKTPAVRSERVMMRGGSWGNHPRYCRSISRNAIYPEFRLGARGLRVCCLIAPRQTGEYYSQKSPQIKALATEATILMEGSSDYLFRLSWRPGSGAVAVSNGDQAIAVTRGEIDAIASGVKILLDQEADSTND